MVLSLRELLPANPLSPTALPVFNGDDDAYGWVLDIDKFLAETEISSTSKLLIAASGLQGAPLQWWLQWSHHHPMASWESFIVPFLRRFKPEWRQILPVLDGEIERDSESQTSSLNHVADDSMSKNRGSSSPIFVSDPTPAESCLPSPIFVSDLEFDSHSVTNFTLDSVTPSDHDNSAPAKCDSLSLFPILKEKQSPSTEDLTTAKFVPPPQHLNHDVVVNPPLPQTPPKPPDRHCRVVTDAPDPSFASDDSTMPPPPPAPPDQQWHTIEEDDVLGVIPTDQKSSETKLQPTQSFIHVQDVLSLLDWRCTSDLQCRCLRDARRNNPTKSPPPKPPDWNYNEVPSLLSELPDLCCCTVAPMRFNLTPFYHSFHIHSCVGTIGQPHAYVCHKGAFQFNPALKPTTKQYGSYYFGIFRPKFAFIFPLIAHRHQTLHAIGYGDIVVVAIERYFGCAIWFDHPSILVVFKAWHKEFGGFAMVFSIAQPVHKKVDVCILINLTTCPSRDCSVLVAAHDLVISTDATSWTLSIVAGTLVITLGTTFLPTVHTIFLCAFDISLLLLDLVSHYSSLSIAAGLSNSLFQKLHFSLEQLMSCLVAENMLGNACFSVAYYANRGNGSVITMNLWLFTANEMILFLSTATTRLYCGESIFIIISPLCSPGFIILNVRHWSSDVVHFSIRVAEFHFNLDYVDDIEFYNSSALTTRVHGFVHGGGENDNSLVSSVRIPCQAEYPTHGTLGKHISITNPWVVLLFRGSFGLWKKPHLPTKAHGTTYEAKGPHREAPVFGNEWDSDYTEVLILIFSSALLGCCNYASLGDTPHLEQLHAYTCYNLAALFYDVSFIHPRVVVTGYDVKVAIIENYVFLMLSKREDYALILVYFTSRGAKFHQWDPGTTMDDHAFILVSIIFHSVQFQLWDPGEHFQMSQILWSFQFKQWDPGGYSFVHWNCLLVWVEILKDAYVTVEVPYNYNLEDKVDFDGVGNVMIIGIKEIMVVLVYSRRGFLDIVFE